MLDLSPRRALFAATALALVAGCSGNSAPLTPTQSSPAAPSGQRAPLGMRFVQGSAVEGRLLVPAVPHPWNLPHVRPDRKKKREVLFVADPQNNQVLMYNPRHANPSPEGSITNGITYPFGIAVDKKGTLYVDNLLGSPGNTGSITIYPKNSSSPSLTITTGINGPYGIAVDSQGNVFASNLNDDTIVGYRAGATTPYETINFGALGQALGLGVDANDNIWVASDTNSLVYEIPAGSSTPQNANLAGLNGDINVAFGKDDVMYVSNFGGSNVKVYAYGTTTPLMTITQGIEQHGPTLSGFTSRGAYFQSNQNGNVSGYKSGQSTPFSTITGIPDPRGIASTPLIKK